MKEKLLTHPLIGLKDICGDLHVHSDWSDGQQSVFQMAEAAKRRGYQYLGISDHSYKLQIAGGLSVEKLVQKKKEIDDLNEGQDDFRILFGSEVEIDTEGNLDYNSPILAEFDLVIAAVHTDYEQSPAKMTKRLVNACQNKHVHVLAHPMGIHAGQREARAIDLKEVSRAALDHNVFLEINAFPSRMDLNASHVEIAKSLGVKFVINTDSHHTEHLEFMKDGIAVAQQAGLGKEDVLNTLSFNELLKAIQK